MFSRIALFSILIGISSVSLRSQGETQAVTLQEDSITLRCEVLLDDPELKHQLDRTYFSYYRERVQENQGGHTGRLLHGSYREMGTVGKLLLAGNFAYGLKNGVWKKWDEQGVLREVYAYKEGIKNGDFQEFDADGQLKREGKFQQDLLEGKIKLYADGEIEKIERYRKGEKVVQEKEGSDKKKTIRALTKASPSKKKPRASMVNSSGLTVSNRSKLPKTVSNNLARLPSRSVAIFIVSEADDSPIVSANVKISSYGNGSTDHRQTSGFSGSDGVYYLLRDSLDYVVKVKHPGYGEASVRIDREDQRDNYLLKLPAEADCGKVIGTIQRADVAVGLGTVHVVVTDKNRKAVADTYTNPNGQFQLCLPCNQLYRIALSKDQYSASQEELFLPTNCGKNSEALNYYLNKQQVASAFPTPKVNNAPKPQLPAQVASKETTPPRVNERDQSRPTWNAREDLSTANNNRNKAFTVVAGTFSVQSNAQNRLKEIKQAGYPRASIEVDPASKMYQIIVDRFPDQAAATQFKQAFRKKTQFNAFVRNP